MDRRTQAGMMGIKGNVQVCLEMNGSVQIWYEYIKVIEIKGYTGTNRHVKVLGELIDRSVHVLWVWMEVFRLDGNKWKRSGLMGINGNVQVGLE